MPFWEKMKIEVDPLIGRPKSRVQSAKFTSQVWVMTRDVLLVPRRWKEVDVHKSLESGIDHMQIHMDVNLDKPGVKQCVIERLQSSSRQLRCRLHKHYLKYPNLEKAKKNRPHSCHDQQNWESLCHHFNLPEFKNQSRANTRNREKLRALHITGRTPFTVIQNEISEKADDECDMIELYKRTHYTVKDGWSSDEAGENWDEMIARKAKYAEEGIEKTEQEIATEVLGHASGYIKGVGYGPKPPGKRSTLPDLNTQHLQEELAETQEKLQDSEG